MLEREYQESVRCRDAGLSEALLGRLEASALWYRLARGAFWGLGGSISRGINLLASIVSARVLGKDGFGELGTNQNTVAMFTFLAGFGTGATATKYVAEFRQSDREKARRDSTSA